jgi:hypothetical protein
MIRSKADGRLAKGEALVRSWKLWWLNPLVRSVNALAIEIAATQIKPACAG